MATGANEGKFLQAQSLYKVFERTGQANATLNSGRLSFGRRRRFVLWIKLTNQSGGPSTWTLTVYHLRPEGTDGTTAADRVAHATTLAQAGNGLKRQQYGEWGASAALPEILGNEIAIEGVGTGGGNVDVEVWVEFLD